MLGFVFLIADAAASTPRQPPVVEHPAGILAVLMAVLALIFQAAQHPATRGLFRVVPILVFCYFIPTALNTVNVIPPESPLYDWVKTFVLPASLLLLILALDLPGILRLGPKAVIMLLAGTAGIVIGGPLSLWICADKLPEDAWRGMSALCGSWIGGGANFVALGQAAEATDTMIGAMVIVDVFVASIWMGVLLYSAGFQHQIDNWTGANASAIRDLEQRMEDFEQRTTRVPSLADLMLILAIGFAGAWLSYKAGFSLKSVFEPGAQDPVLSPTTWKFILVTAAGVALSFTRARNLEGAGAAKLGSVMIYLLVACIGASADFSRIGEYGWFIAMGFIWMATHVIVLLTVAKLIRAPIFFVAVGSQANIGGAASAPVVAAAFHGSLAPVGALLAVAGYVLGTYAGLLCMTLLKSIAGAQ